MHLKINFCNKKFSSHPPLVFTTVSTEKNKTKQKNLPIMNLKNRPILRVPLLSNPVRSPFFYPAVL